MGSTDGGSCRTLHSTGVVVTPKPEDTFFAPEQIARDARVLDVGCGDHKKVPWAIGLDRVKTAATDVVHDLDTYPWPFPDNHFDVIVASHVVEHLEDILRLGDELHRIAKPGAQIRIATPHYSNPDAFIDPTHRHQFGYRSFEYFARRDQVNTPRAQVVLSRVLGMGSGVAGWYTEPRFEILERTITFRRLHRTLGFDRLARHVPLFYEYFLGGIAPARDMQVVLRVLKPASPS
jgi:SAM-dependent methyltransferase